MDRMKQHDGAEELSRESSILRDKNHQAPSVCTPEALLRQAHRQKGVRAGAVPEICILDPDGSEL
jgi:hypothetical protein